VVYSGAGPHVSRDVRRMAMSRILGVVLLLAASERSLGLQPSIADELSLRQFLDAFRDDASFRVEHSTLPLQAELGEDEGCWVELWDQSQVRLGFRPYAAGRRRSFRARDAGRTSFRKLP
jgi:hypothetical protein